MSVREFKKLKNNLNWHNYKCLIFNFKEIKDKAVKLSQTRYYKVSKFEICTIIIMDNFDV